MELKDLFMYKGEHGEGTVFRSKTIEDINTLKRQGWFDCPTKAIEASKKKTNLKTEPRRKMYVEKLTRGRHNGNS